MNLKSPLIGSQDIVLLKTFEASQLINDWNHSFNIDITSELRGYKEIHLYQCRQTKLRFFFPSDIAGSDRLYEQLQRFDWFYMPNKWEHKVALKNFSRCENVLEVGCAFGSFVESALKAGVNIQGNEQRHKLENYLRQLLKHFLLYQYWESEKSYCAKGWIEEIDNFRSELDLLLESKVLYSHSVKTLDKVYQKARSAAIRKSQLSPQIFPETSPYSLVEILNPDWLP